MKERPIYEIHVNIKDTSSDNVIMYTEGKKYASVKLAHDRLKFHHEIKSDSSFLTTNNLRDHTLHQTYTYPSKTVDVFMAIKKETLVEEDE